MNWVEGLVPGDKVFVLREYKNIRRLYPNVVAKVEGNLTWLKHGDFKERPFENGEEVEKFSFMSASLLPDSKEVSEEYRVQSLALELINNIDLIKKHNSFSSLKGKLKLTELADFNALLTKINKKFS